MPGGRPLKFKTLKELEEKIEAYFEANPPGRRTITGLALALDTSRDTLMDYEGRPQYSDTIKKAKLRIEEDYELSLRTRGTAGDIFGLKNFGWRDKQEVDQKTEHSGGISVTIKKFGDGDGK